MSHVPGHLWFQHGSEAEVTKVSRERGYMVLTCRIWIPEHRRGRRTRPRRVWKDGSSDLWKRARAEEATCNAVLQYLGGGNPPGIDPWSNYRADPWSQSIDAPEKEGADAFNGVENADASKQKGDML